MENLRKTIEWKGWNILARQKSLLWRRNSAQETISGGGKADSGLKKETHIE